MSAPRVLLSGVALSQPMGGVVRHGRELLPRAAQRLAARGGALAVLEGSAGLPFDLPREVERLPSPVPARPAAMRASIEGGWLRRTLAAAVARGRPFDLVHVAHLPAPRSLPVPLVLLLHDLKALHGEHEGLPRRLLARRVVTSALRRAALVLTVSAALREEVLALHGLDPERVRVVPNAADHLRPLPRGPGPEAALIHVGHVEPRKNLELLVRALAHDASLPRLILAGAPKGREDVRLRDLAARLGVAARVEFVGLLDDEALRQLYAQAACAVFPSRREGFGIPALEARLAGVPVAVSSSPALVETAGADAPRFPPDDPAACARAVRAALATPPAELERAARRAAALTWDDAAGRLVEAWCQAATAAS